MMDFSFPVELTIIMHVIAWIVSLAVVYLTMLLINFVGPTWSLGYASVRLLVVFSLGIGVSSFLSSFVSAEEIPAGFQEVTLLLSIVLPTAIQLVVFGYCVQFRKRLTA